MDHFMDTITFRCRCLPVRGIARPLNTIGAFTAFACASAVDFMERLADEAPRNPLYAAVLMRRTADHLFFHSPGKD